MPLIILITLSTRIYQGLIKVKKNLNRHKRLVERAETAETIGDKSPQQRATRCTLKLDVINEQDQMEGNLFAIIFKRLYQTWNHQTKTATMTSNLEVPSGKELKLFLVLNFIL